MITMGFRTPNKCGFDYNNNKIQYNTLNIYEEFILEKRESLVEDKNVAVAGDYINVPVRIKKVDVNNNAKPLKGGEIEILKKWLLNCIDDKYLIFKDKNYKGTFIKIKDWDEHYKDGYVNLIFRMLNYSFSNILEDRKVVSGKYNINIKNLSDAVDKIDTKIYIIGDCNITIKNLTNGDFVNKKVNKEMYINNITLNKGVNNIEITTDSKVTVRILHQEVFTNSEEVLQPCLK